MEFGVIDANLVRSSLSTAERTADDDDDDGDDHLNDLIAKFENVECLDLSCSSE